MMATEKKKWAIRTLKILDGMICTSRRDTVDARQRGKPVMLRFCCLVKATLVPRFARNGSHVAPKEGNGRHRIVFNRALLSGKKTDENPVINQPFHRMGFCLFVHPNSVKSRLMNCLSPLR